MFENNKMSYRGTLERMIIILTHLSGLNYADYMGSYHKFVTE